VDQAILGHGKSDGDCSINEEKTSVCSWDTSSAC